MKLLMPAIRIWLDVDELDDVGKLEESVKSSATFIVFLSKGYFKSKNCRQELYAALDETPAGQLKPIISVWEADENKGGAPLKHLREEAIKALKAGERPAKDVVEAALQRVFDSDANAPISWVRLRLKN